MDLGGLCVLCGAIGFVLAAFGAYFGSDDGFIMLILSIICFIVCTVLSILI